MSKAKRQYGARADCSMFHRVASFLIVGGSSPDSARTGPGGGCANTWHPARCLRWAGQADSEVVSSEVAFQEILASTQRDMDLIQVSQTLEQWRPKISQLGQGRPRRKVGLLHCDGEDAHSDAVFTQGPPASSWAA